MHGLKLLLRLDVNECSRTISLVSMEHIYSVTEAVSASVIRVSCDWCVTAARAQTRRMDFTIM
jgi:hypothetical protein